MNNTLYTEWEKILEFNDQELKEWIKNAEFEDGLRLLEALSQGIESGLSLKYLTKAFKVGTLLSKHLTANLDAALLEIEHIRNDNG